ncbi:HupE/UreJ family protein [Phenylobacterium sp.]|uniref:HupE/UreJ family protein n=1 Tax=Phenylobacterium sp. TaxID=1871053 RepID=UPI0039833AAB
MRAWLGALVGFLLLCAGGATAHEIRPVFLDLRETLPGHYDVTWKRPVFNSRPLAIRPRFEPRCALAPAGASQVTGSFAIERTSLACPGGLAGTRVDFDGLPGAMVDGLVRVQFASGEVITGRVLPSRPAFDIPRQGSPAQVLATYVGLGLEHILLGYDHLLFVLALVLFVGSWRRLLVTATAFTAAHSITLSLAALGVIHVPVPPVEALIALSILLLAVEVLRARDDPSRAAGLRPATLAFGFGLLHGLGFASALADIGLPQHEIPLALFAFNVGVELGQIAFIAALLGLGWLARGLGPTPRRWAYTTASYAIGGLAAFWTLERVAGF